MARRGMGPPRPDASARDPKCAAKERSYDVPDRPGCCARCQSIGTMLAASLAETLTTTATSGQHPPAAAAAKSIRCRRCSQRQGRGEALVSEWFVSEGRYPQTVTGAERCLSPRRLSDRILTTLWHEDVTSSVELRCRPRRTLCDLPLSGKHCRLKMTFH